MKRILLLITCVLVLHCAACEPTERVAELPPRPGNDSGGDNDTDPEEPAENKQRMKIQITVGAQTFTATLQTNATAMAFIERLPMTVSMTELNGNEKYHLLPQHLPSASVRPGTIRNGELMLYGSDCLVLFYKTFSTSYSYTRLGAIDSPVGLESALGAGNVTVTFKPVSDE